MSENPFGKHLSPEGNPFGRHLTDDPVQPQQSGGGAGNYFKETAQNFGPDVGRLAKGLVVGLPVAAARGVAQTALHPLQTAGDVTSAVGRLLLNSVTLAPPEDDPVSKAVSGYLLDKYGSWEKIKKTFHDEPAGFMLDAITGLKGLGGLTRGSAEAVAANAAKTGAGVAAKVPSVNMVLGTTAKAEKAVNALDFVEGPQVTKAVNSAATVTPAVKAARTAKSAQKVANVGKGMEATADFLNPLSGKALKVAADSNVPGLNSLARGTLNVLAVPGNALTKVGNAFTDLRDKRTATWRNALGDKLELVRDTLRNSVGHEPVPGTSLNAAEAAVSARSTGLSELQMNPKITKANSKVADLHADQQAKNNAALQAHLGLISGTDADRFMLSLNRDVKAAPLYDAARAEHAPGVTYKHSGPVYDPVLQKLMVRPPIEEAFRAAQAEALAKGEHLFEPVMWGNEANRGMLTGSGVHNVKLALDHMIEKAHKASLTPEAAIAYKGLSKEALVKAKDDFLRWAETHVPDYRNAREQFAKDSLPVDQTTIGKHLKDELGTALEEKTATGRHDKFAQTVADAPKLLKNSLQDFRYQDLSKALPNGETRYVQDVLDHLDRGKQVEKLAGQAASGIKGTEPSGGGIPVTKAGAVHKLVEKITSIGPGRISKELAAEIGTVLASPATTADELDKVLKILAKRKQLGVVKKAVSNTLRTPAVYNMLAPSNQENQNALNR